MPRAVDPSRLLSLESSSALALEPTLRVLAALAWDAANTARQGPLAPEEVQVLFHATNRLFEALANQRQIL